MGNSHPSDTGANSQFSLVGFHNIHGGNIQVSTDGRKAKRLETFCNGICFGDRPIAVGERVFVRVAEVSTSWSGVLRFGFTSNDPLTIDPTTLPRYACPDLTNKPGYWAKALPEKHAQHGNVLQFCVTRLGDVHFAVNGEEKGIFFGNVSVDCKLWPLVDIYGNTIGVEFIDPKRLVNTRVKPHPQSINSQMSYEGTHSVSLPDVASPIPPPVPVRHNAGLSPLTFHRTTGKNMSLSQDLTIATRKSDEYCNGYVFTSRPLRLGERIVIQVLNTDSTFSGGMAFGMTSCDISKLHESDLPDDSDLLLDRLEYWVVNKDVCSKPAIHDELSFHLTVDGEIRYGKNGLNLSTLMHVDRSITLWAFFDVYGNMQKIKLLGVSSGDNFIPQVTMNRPINGHNTISASTGRNMTSNSSLSPRPLPPPLRTSPTTLQPALPPKPIRLMNSMPGQQNQPIKGPPIVHTKKKKVPTATLR